MSFSFNTMRIKKNLISQTCEIYFLFVDVDKVESHSSFCNNNFCFVMFQMWIYSLGRTLMKTMPAILPPESDEKHMQQQHHSSIVLQATIWKMCKNVDERASLMFLLNVSCFNFPKNQKFSCGVCVLCCMKYTREVDKFCDE